MKENNNSNIARMNRKVNREQWNWINGSKASSFFCAVDNEPLTILNVCTLGGCHKRYDTAAPQQNDDNSDDSVYQIKEGNIIYILLLLLLRSFLVVFVVKILLNGIQQNHPESPNQWMRNCYGFLISSADSASQTPPLVHSLARSRSFPFWLVSLHCSSLAFI